MMEKLKDIKPLVEIPDYSFYLYLGFIVVVTLLASLAVYLLIKLMTKKGKNRRQEILEHLRSMDLKQSKNVAYEFTKWGRYLVRDESQAKMYEDIVRKLTRYKYKKEAPPLDEELKREIKLFLRVNDE
ncbi:MAG: hypothetical protein C6H99_06895 [Epsilonproteobacteria bacterium]|nr:hypothetical protein [Campylobacterota bacterium]NPA64144.1 hypothetical protein [Campylobacterota bacterium]